MSEEAPQDPTYEGNPANFRTPLYPGEAAPGDVVAPAESPTTPIRVEVVDAAEAEAEPAATETEEDLGETAVEATVSEPNLTGRVEALDAEADAALEASRAAAAGAETPEAPPPAPEPAPAETETGSGEAAEEEPAVSEANAHMVRFVPEASRGWVMDRLQDVANMPKVKRIVGKLRIAYSDHFVKKHQERALEAKQETTGYEVQLQAIDRAIAAQEQQVARMKAAGTPGYEGLQVSIQEMARERAKLKAKHDKAQTKLESRNDELDINVNKRDKIANEVIDFFDQRLGPIEDEMERMELAREHLELVEAVVEAEIEVKMADMAQEDEDMRQLAETLRAAGKSEREIKKLTQPKALKKLRAQTYKEIEAARKSLEAQKAGIDSEMAGVKARYNPLADIREEFKRVKAIRPAEVGVPERVIEPEFTGRQDISSNPRSVAGGEATTYPDLTHPGPGEGSPPSGAETAAARPPATTLAQRVETYNSTADDDEKIDLADFLARSVTTGDRPFSEAAFKKMAQKYLKYRQRLAASG